MSQGPHVSVQRTAAHISFLHAYLKEVLEIFSFSSQTHPTSRIVCDKHVVHYMSESYKLSEQR